MRTVFLDRDSLDQGDIDFGCLDQIVPDWRSYPYTETEQVLERIRSAEIVITNKVLLTATLLQQAYSLRLICVAATGFNNVDVAAASRLGIPVCNVKGYSTPSVAEHVFGLLLYLSRHTGFYLQAARDGRWTESKQFCVLGPSINELHGKKLGIVGYGELGRRVAQLARAFEMEVLLAERPDVDTPRSGRLPLNRLLPQVDILSLHCPLTPQTYHMIGASELAAMRSHALLVNTARGGIVDEYALADALRRGKIAGAAVDVLSSEPPRDGNILLHPDIPNLVVTPHIAWAGRQARQRLVEDIANNIAAFSAGNVRNRVS